MSIPPEVHPQTLVELIYTLYLLTCQVRATVGDWGLCCCVCVATFEHKLTPLCVDSAREFWASFLFQIVVFADLWLIAQRERICSYV